MIIKISDEHVDYYQGRMVKFQGRKRDNGEWEFSDNISTDYQSWIRKYASYLALAEAAKQ